MSNIDFTEIIPKIDKILARGLSKGIGEAGKQVCVEAAICEALNLPHGDNPGCVSKAVRRYKIELNDCKWSSPDARAKGLRNLAIAQLGTKDVIQDQRFIKILTEKTIRILIPTLFREIFSGNSECLKAANSCELEGNLSAAIAAAAIAAAYAATNAADAAAAYTAYTAAYAAANAAANAAAYADTADAAYAYADTAVYAAANAAAYAAANAAACVVTAADIAADTDKYLLLGAKLALEVLIELKAPGVAYLNL